MGSGLVIASASKILEAAGCAGVKYLGVDFNPKALNLSQRLFDHNKISNIELKESNLLQEVTELQDIIIFNPPYVSTPQEEL